MPSPRYGAGRVNVSDGGDGSRLYDEQSGPPSAGRVRMPEDLVRSRRAGITRLVCSECNAVQGTGMTSHDAGCSCPGTWERERTEALSYADPQMEVRKLPGGYVLELIRGEPHTSADAEFKRKGRV
jgi:hypothetical protein